MQVRKKTPKKKVPFLVRFPRFPLYVSIGCCTVNLCGLIVSIVAFAVSR